MRRQYFVKGGTVKRKCSHVGNVFLLIFVFFLFMAGSSCTSDKGGYQLLEVENPEYYPNTEFKSFEDLTSPKFAHLIEKFRLDTIFHGETDEFKRILLLRDWMKSTIKIEDFNPHYPGGDYAETILDFALKGEGFHCAHFMRVQNAIMNSYGYVTRVLNSGPGAKGGPDGNHGINEIWSNQYCKWFLSDAKYNHHFEKDGIPLSVLEIREEFLKNKAADIVLVKGPDRTPIEFDPEFDSKTKERFAQTYTWPRWYLYGNRYTIYPEEYNHLSIAYVDDFFSSSIYYRDGKPVSQEVFDWWVKTKDKKVIEWTPNVLKVTAKVDGEKLNIHIASDTPNLKEYQMKEGVSGLWMPVNEKFDLNLSKNNHIYFFRSVNLANATGPESVVVAVKK
ncbi:transglutaminase domain-containing protein [Mariniphaga sediminis]|uniref:transglutaminase domain-containing protein n=1 Tax=Mariniphaga sediminis TaxID=1628158 RepID=UPI00356AD3CE